jgi:hypothetical protein
MYLYVNRPEERKKEESLKVEDMSAKVIEPEDSPKLNKIEVIDRIEGKQPIRSDGNIQMK